MITHEHGTMYKHARRPEWGAALYRGTREGKARFVFVDGTARDFGEDFAHLLEPVEQAAVETMADAEPTPYAPRPPKPRADSWTPDQDALALAGEPVPGRTPGAVKARRRKLLGPEVRRHKARRWTSVEDLDVAQSDDPVAVIAERLHRTAKAVTARRATLGCSRRRVLWTPAEDALLRAGKPIPNRGREAIRARRYALGLTRSVLWTDAEDALALAGRPVPGRSRDATAQRRRVLLRAAKAGAR